MRRSLVAGFTLMAFLLVTLPAGRGFAQGDPERESLNQAKAHFQAGRTAFAARDYSGAIREFKTAQAIRPSPVLDYNIGLAYEQLGNTHEAAKYFRRYIEGKPDAPNRADVERRLSVLEPPSTTGGEEAPPPPPPPPAPPSSDPYGANPAYQPPPPSGQPAPVAAQAPRKRSMWWIVFPIAGGVTLLALFIGLYVAASGSGYGSYYLTTPAPNPPSPSHDDPGLLFRF